MMNDLILLFGMPRSGTTWIGKIFDSHPDTVYRHEPDSCLRLNDVPLMACASEEQRFGHIVRDFAAKACRVRAEPILPIFPKSYYSTVALVARKGAVYASKALGKYLGGPGIPDFVDIDRNPKIRMVWKSIESVGRLGLFLNVLENARAVLILRHPCGQIASVLSGEAAKKFTDPTPSSEDYGTFQILLETESARSRDLTSAALKEMESVERLAWCWLLINEKAMKDTQGIERCFTLRYEDQGIERCFTLRYEDLCDSPADKARELFNFCGLEWSSQTQAFIRRSTGRNSARYYSVFKNPLHSINKWREQLQQEQVVGIMEVVKDSLPGRLYFPEDPKVRLDTPILT